MKIIGRELVETFGVKHADVRSPIDRWLYRVDRAQWDNMAEMKADFPKVSLKIDSIFIFDIKSYRLTADVLFKAKTVQVLKIETHEIYDKKNKRGK